MEQIPVRFIDAPHKESILSDGFRSRDVKAILDGKDLKQGLHRHDFFFILVLEKGSGSHEIDFTSYEVSDHQVFFMRPGQVHQLELNAGSTGYLMEFRPDFYYPQDRISNELLQKVSGKNVCTIDGDRFQKMMFMLTSILDEFTHKEDRYQQVIQSNLSSLFVELVRQQRHSDTNSGNATNYSQERLDEFLHLLNKHITEHKQVSKYAELLNLSPYQLNSITKSTLGKTCSELIDDHIILEAKRYLLATSNQVTQIAYALGYEDGSYFSRFFKKHTGHTPEAFRNNFK